MTGTEKGYIMNKLLVVGVFVALFACVSVNAATIDIRWPCLFHLSIKFYEGGKSKTFDCYGIASTDKGVQHFTHLIASDRETAAVLNCKDKCQAAGNMTGTCTSFLNDDSLAAAAAFVDSYTGLTLSFEARATPTSANCPNGDKGCKKYTSERSSREFIIVDSMGRLVKRSLSADTYYTYTWLDGVPSMDMFSESCLTEQWDKANPNCPKVVHINYGCAFHGKESSSYGGEGIEFYGMMKDIIWWHMIMKKRE